MADKSKDGGAPIIIKKYANRRLYNTATSTYVTLDHLSQMVRDDQEFVVYDAKSGDDITRAVLTQIIFEEEGKGQSLLPVGFLRRLISLYGDGVQAFVPRYLEMAMDTFAGNQEQMRKNLENAFGGMFPFSQVEKMGKENMAMFQQAMDMFSPSPGAGPNPDREEAGASDEGKADDDAAADEGDAVDALRQQMAAMQQQLDELTRRKK